MTRKSNSLSTIKSSSYVCFLILPRDVETGENDQEATWLNYCCQIGVFALIGRFVMEDVYSVYSRNWDLWLSLTCIERPQSDSTCQVSAWRAAKVRVPRFWVKNPEKCNFHIFLRHISSIIARSVFWQLSNNNPDSVTYDRVYYNGLMGFWSCWKVPPTLYLCTSIDSFISL